MEEIESYFSWKSFEVEIIEDFSVEIDWADIVLATEFDEPQKWCIWFSRLTWGLTTNKTNKKFAIKIFTWRNIKINIHPRSSCFCLYPHLHTFFQAVIKTLTIKMPKQSESATQHHISSIHSVCHQNKIIGISNFLGKPSLAWLDGAEVSVSGWGSGGPRFQSHPRLTIQLCSRYQLDQLGSKAASESTFKTSNTCGVSNTRLYFTFYSKL